MRILVFGAGAVGQGIGAFLAAAGHRTTLLLRPQYREALSSHGLDVSGVLGDVLVMPEQLELVSDTARLAAGGYDVILLCVKAYDTESSLQAIKAVAGKDTLVVSMQNGYGNVETLASCLGRERVLCARVITGFAIPAPGKVAVTVHGDDIFIGSFYAPSHPGAEELARTLNSSGLPCRAVENVEAALWGKILYNCALNPLGALMGVHYGALGESADTRAIMDTIIEEAFQVMRKREFPCLVENAEEFRRLFYTRLLPPTFNHKPSMLQDLNAGKRTEIDALNGAVVRLGMEGGIPAPVNDVVVRMVHFMAAKAPNRKQGEP